MRPLKDGASADGEVLLALVAAIEAALAGRDAILAAACWADRAIRPQTRFEVKPCGLRVWNQGKEFKSAYRALAHESIVLNSLEGVKYYFCFQDIIFQ